MDSVTIPSDTTISRVALRIQAVTVAFKNVGGAATTVGFPVTLVLPAGATVTSTTDGTWVQGTSKTRWTYTGYLAAGASTAPLTISYLPPKPANTVLTATAALPGDANSKTSKASLKYKITGYDLGVLVIGDAFDHYYYNPYYVGVALYVNGSDNFMASANEGANPVVTVTTNVNVRTDDMDVNAEQGDWTITYGKKANIFIATFNGNVLASPTAAQIPMLEVCYDVYKRGTYTTTATLSFAGDPNAKNNKASIKTAIGWNDASSMRGSFTGDYTVGVAGTVTYEIENLMNYYAVGYPVQVTFQKPVGVTIVADSDWTPIKKTATAETYWVDIPGNWTSQVKFNYLSNTGAPPKISAKIVYPKSTIFEYDYDYYRLDGSASSAVWQPYVINKSGISVSANIAPASPRKTGYSA